MAAAAGRANRRTATPVPQMRDYYRIPGQEPARHQPGYPPQKSYQLGPQLQVKSSSHARDLLKHMQAKENAAEQPKLAPSIVIDQHKLKKIKGQWVDYWSASYQSWIPAEIVDVDNDTGDVFLDVKPTVALSLGEQREKIRQRSLPSPEQVSRVHAIINNGQVQSTASSIFQSVAGNACDAISRPEGLAELGWKVDSLTGLTGSKVHFGAGLTLERFQGIFWQVIQAQQDVSVQAIPHCVADSCIEGTPHEKYDFGEQLGKGTYGEVMCGIHKKSSEKRAIKIISKAKCGRKIEFMKMEIQNLIQLDHPHILKLHEFYNSPEYLYLVTDHCSGGELHARIRRTQSHRGHIPEVWAADVMHQLILAVCHIHARGIIHLDIKSQNIMLMPSLQTKQHFDRPNEDDSCDVSFLERPHIMVIDLGVATIFQPGNFQGQPIGTPATMAPEVWQGVITPEADVFSCGCVLFELLSLEMPWSWKYRGVMQQARDFWSRNPRADWEKVRFANPDAQMLLGKMLEWDRRYRIGAPECLASPFLKMASRKNKSKSEAEQETRTQLLRRLATVHHRDGLYKNVALKIAKDWPPNQMPSFKRLFTELDVSNTGILPEQQLSERLANLVGIDASAAKLAAAAMNMSQNKTAVDWTEFVAACIDLSNTNFQPAIWNIFKAADKDDDDLLSAKDIEGMLPEVHAYSKEAAKNIFISLTGRWSEDGGERVDWNTFVTHLWTQATAGINDKSESSEQEMKAELQAKFGIFAGVMGAIRSTGPQAQQLVDLLAGTTFDTRVKPPSTTARPVAYPRESEQESIPHILQRLEEMGFPDRELNEKILKQNGGQLTDIAILTIMSKSECSRDAQPPSSSTQHSL